MNLSTSIKQKRLIITYFIIGLFALLCNKASLNGTIRKGNPINERNEKYGNYDEKYGLNGINIFTSKGDNYSSPFIIKQQKLFGRLQLL
jgi:hypothetical protein